MPSHQPSLNQVAFSVVDLRLTERWFREGLGFAPAGGSRFMSSSPLAARIQGIARAASTIWWMVGRDAGFQLELFQFHRPIARLLPPDFRPCDIGYTRVGVTVEDFDATLARLADLGTQPCGPAIGERGCRRVCVRNPDGVYVEIMEDDPLGGSIAASAGPVKAAVRSLTVSTPDLDSSIRYFSSVCGKGPDAIQLHTPEHEALWGLDGARCKRAVFQTGSVLLEVVQYLDPPGKPWPTGYRICDQGILNIAFDADDQHAFRTIYERVLSVGATPNCTPIHLPFHPRASVVYVNDPLGFSVELVWMAPGRDRHDWGWHAMPLAQRPDPDNQRICERIRLRSPVDEVWRVITDQEAMSNWIGFDPVKLTRAGFADDDGIGSERTMHGPLGQVVEQTVALEPNHLVRYRVIEGSPFEYHQGEIQLAPFDSETDLTWTIRFRSRLPFTGRLWRILMRRMLARMLSHGLKRYVEGCVPAATLPLSS